MIWPEDFLNRMVQGDALTVLRQMPDEVIQTCVTSPPYWGLRDYGIDGQLGLEKTPEEYVEKMVAVFREVWRVLRGDGTIWLNLGDSYGTGTTAARQEGTLNLGEGTNEARKINRIGQPAKQLIGIPWRVAFALQQDGWYLRSDIIWAKPNPMPESVKDRPTKAHEYIFLMSKNQRYYYDADAIAESGTGRETFFPFSPYLKRLTETNQRNDGDRANLNPCINRNKRSVWTIPTQPFPDAHFAVFPPKLIEPCILAGCPEGGVVLDPFCGSGTTCYVAKEFKRDYIGIDISSEYLKMAERRTAQGVL